MALGGGTTTEGGPMTLRAARRFGGRGGTLNYNFVRWLNDLRGRHCDLRGRQYDCKGRH